MTPAPATPWTQLILSDVGRALPKLEWYDKSFLVPHEAMRHDMKKMSKAMTVRNVPQSQSWKVRAFMDWYKKHFHAYVHHHHDIEEKIFFPWIETRCELPKKVADDHKELVRMLDGILDFDQELEKAMGDTSKWTLAMGRLERAIKEMVDSMTAHLDEEEQVVVPRLAEKFTEQEHDEAVADKILKQMPISELSLSVPKILYAMEQWGGPEEATRFLGALPLPLRLMTVQFWVPAYKQRSLDVIDSLALDQDEPPAAIVEGPGMFCCGGQATPKSAMAGSQVFLV